MERFDHYKFDITRVYNDLTALLRSKRDEFLSKRDTYAHDPEAFIRDIGEIWLGCMSEVGLHPYRVLYDLKQVADGWYPNDEPEKSQRKGAAAQILNRLAVDRARAMLAVRGADLADEGQLMDEIIGCVADLLNFADYVGFESWIITQAANDLTSDDLLQASRFKAARHVLEGLPGKVGEAPEDEQSTLGNSNELPAALPHGAF